MPAFVQTRLKIVQNVFDDDEAGKQCKIINVGKEMRMQENMS